MCLIVHQRVTVFMDNKHHNRRWCHVIVCLTLTIDYRSRTEAHRKSMQRFFNTVDAIFCLSVLQMQPDLDSQTGYSSILNHIAQLSVKHEINAEQPRVIRNTFCSRLTLHDKIPLLVWTVIRISSQDVAVSAWRDSRLPTFLASFKWRGNDDAMTAGCWEAPVDGGQFAISDASVADASVSSNFCFYRNIITQQSV